MIPTLLLLAASYPRRQTGWGICLLAATLLMSAAAPAVAARKDTPPTPRDDAPLQNDYPREIHVVAPFLYSPALHASSREIQGNYDEVLSAIEAYPDVRVFPLLVAGPVVAADTRNLANLIAQAPVVGGIAIIYPDIGEPYRSIFTQIIDGIETKARGRVFNVPIGADVNVGELNDALRRKETKVVIALGRHGMKVASALDANIGVVVGGVLTAPENEARNLQVNSLSPDPALLFARLKELMPRARRVHVVYDPRQNAWLLRLAKEAARAHNMEIVAHEAQDLRGAVRAYQEILASADSKHDALWLLQDSTTVEDSAVMPLVLQESWARNLAVFSSSFGHVKRGVLFSLYPDNVGLGRNLAVSALDFMASGESRGSGMAPLREVLIAINMRTAKHLDLDASRLQKFDMAFPEQ